MGPADLGKVDLLVREGLYSNCTDFIRTAIRNQLDRHGDEVRQVGTRQPFVVGLLAVGRQELERQRARGERTSLRVIGSLDIGADVPAERAAEVIDRVSVRGLFHASAAVKAALADRTD